MCRINFMIYLCHIILSCIIILWFIIFLLHLISVCRICFKSRHLSSFLIYFDCNTFNKIAPGMSWPNDQIFRFGIDLVNFTLEMRSSYSTRKVRVLRYLQANWKSGMELFGEINHISCAPAHSLQFGHARCIRTEFIFRHAPGYVCLPWRSLIMLKTFRSRYTATLFVSPCGSELFLDVITDYGSRIRDET